MQICRALDIPYNETALLDLSDPNQQHGSDPQALADVMHHDQLDPSDADGSDEDAQSYDYNDADDDDNYDDQDDMMMHGYEEEDDDDRELLVQCGLRQGRWERFEQVGSDDLVDSDDRVWLEQVGLPPGPSASLLHLLLVSCQCLSCTICQYTRVIALNRCMQKGLLLRGHT